MILVDTTAYKEKRFEILKKTLEIPFLTIKHKTLIFNTWT